MVSRKILLAVAIIPLVLTVFYPIGSILLTAVRVPTDGSISLAALVEASTDPVYLGLIFSTMILCILTAALTVLLALPVSLFAWTRPERYRGLTIALLVVPMFMSYIVKIYTMRSLLSRTGMINDLLISIRVIDKPMTFLLYNRGAVLTTFVVLLIPFVVLPIYLSLERIPANIVMAARDLGASYGIALRDVILPLAMPGIVAGALFAFILALGDFVTPQMVGGPNGMTFGRVVWTQFGLAFNYSLGSALGVVLLAVTLAAFGAAALANRLMKRA
jgi:spermidine/putrescine transport system permease protein